MKLKKLFIIPLLLLPIALSGCAGWWEPSDSLDIGIFGK